ncbi:MAG TPA: cupin domain-containing protein [Ardenticatenaceae bacterium]
MIRKQNVDERSLPWQSHAYHVSARFKVLEVGGMGLTTQVLYVEVDVGGRILPHAQKQSEFLFCLEGEGSFSLNGEETELRAGDSVAIPRQQVQGVQNQGDEPLRLLVIQAAEGTPERIGWLRALLPR